MTKIFNSVMCRFPIWGFLILATILMAISGATGWFVTDHSHDTLDQTKAKWIEFVDGPSSRIMMFTEIAKKQGVNGVGETLGSWLTNQDPETAEELIAELDEIHMDLEIYGYLQPSEAELTLLKHLADHLNDLRAAIAGGAEPDKVRVFAEAFSNSFNELHISLQDAYAHFADTMGKNHERLVLELTLAQQAIVAASVTGILIFAVMQIFGVSRPLIRLVRRLRQAETDDELNMNHLGGCREVVSFVHAYKAMRLRVDEARKLALTQLAFEIQARIEGVVTKLSENSNHIRGQSETMRERADVQLHQFEDVSEHISHIQQCIHEFGETTQQLVDDLESGKVRLSNSQKSTQKAGEVIGQSRRNIGELATLTNDVQSITSQIGAIASQTNMLAMNAAIEAERAGAAGNGFAVVAREVRALAGRTAQATEGVSDQLKRLQVVGEQCSRAVDELAVIVDGVVSETTQFLQVLSTQVENSHKIMSGSRAVETTAVDMINKAADARKIATTTLQASDSLRMSATEVQASSESVKTTLHSLLERLWAA